MTRKPKRKPPAKSKTNTGNLLKGRFGFLILLLSTLFLAASITFFVGEGNTVGGIQVGKQKDTFGWVMMLFAMFFAVTGLSIAITMLSKKNDDD